MNYLARDGATLAWTDEGAGPAVIWAHGLMSDSFTLERVGIFDLTPLEECSRFVRYDARGHGRSSGRAEPDDFRWSNLASDLLALADSVQRDGPIAAIGCSMGTATILHAALKAPSRFDRVVLTAPPTAWETRRAQASVYERLAELVEREGKSAALEMMKRLPRPAIFSNLPQLPIEVDVGVLPSLLRGAGSSDLPAIDELRRLALPVLILAWEGDSSHPVATAERLAEAIPGADLQVSTSLEEVRGWGRSAAEFLVKE
jgi:pimeloyl-ACP methyl ester carboxylesterase